MIVVRTKNCHTRDTRRGSTELRESVVKETIPIDNSRRTDITGEGIAGLPNEGLELPLHAIALVDCV